MTAAVANREIVRDAPKNSAANASWSRSTRSKRCRDGNFHPWRRKPTGLDAIEYAREVVALGAGEILLTSMDRDGTNRLRPRAHPRRHGRGRRPGHRLRRRRNSRPSRRRRQGRRRKRRARRIDFSFRRIHHRRGQALYGERRPADAPGCKPLSALCHRATASSLCGGEPMTEFRLEDLAAIIEARSRADAGGASIQNHCLRAGRPARRRNWVRKPSKLVIAAMEKDQKRPSSAKARSLLYHLLVLLHQGGAFPERGAGGTRKAHREIRP